MRMSGCDRGHGRPSRGSQDMLAQQDLPFQEEEVGQNDVAVPLAQDAIGALAPEKVGALRESMEILQAKQAAMTIEGETQVSFLKKKFFRSNPAEFSGGPDSIKVDEWLKQIIRSFVILDIRDRELRVVLAAYQLKGEGGQWWKFVKHRVEHTWEAFTHTFQEKFLPPRSRERLRKQFEELRQLDTPVAEFGATFTRLARFAP
ncbi:uncharacterized protein LOC114321257 [Camellia sinensis]|uniref:uncharacterized protein LOC114321257 n=1 Tax=Camellia sinensis TaxID=4442 RepID=UPI0010355122|nr:uncharacterized protein LOC114321257 [Camellia sinensis]